MSSKNRNRQQTQPRKETTVSNNYEDTAAIDAGNQENEAEKIDQKQDVNAGTALPPVDNSQEKPVEDKPADKPTDGVAVEPSAVTTPVVVIPPPAPPVPVDVDTLPLSVAIASRLTIDELKDYIRVMSAKVKMSAVEGGQYQTHLYHILVQLINTRAEDFDVTFGLGMKLIRDNLGGVFSDENIHRYTPHVTLPAKLVAHFRYLLSTVTALAEPTTRKIAARQVNTEQAFRSNAIREDARQRVLNFFNL